MTAASTARITAAITWRHLLQQTSEWEGMLFGKSDIIDRNRNLVVEGKGKKGDPRPLHRPGMYWEYNDVRVNRLALALLRVLRRPLPEVFRERIMRPIGASIDWRWHGYRTSMVEIDGQMVESVSGGSHWGGGVEIHAEDQARIGLLMLLHGAWEGRRVLPASWIAESLVPCALNPNYGLLWWLNTGRARYPSASGGGLLRLGCRREHHLDRPRAWDRRSDALDGARQRGPVHSSGARRVASVARARQSRP